MIETSVPKEVPPRKRIRFSPRFIRKIRNIDDACQKALTGQYNPPMYFQDTLAILETKMTLERFFPEIFNRNSEEKKEK